MNRITKRLRLLQYSGDSVTCPYCKGSFSKFMPYGDRKSSFKREDTVPPVYRDNAACPECGSVERERLMLLYLDRKTDVFKRPQRLLHVAPEKGLSGILKCITQLDYISVDMFDQAMVKADLTRMGFKDSSFDAIICSHVLEHVIDDRAAISELFRVLKPGGWAIIQVPIALTLEKTIEGNGNETPQRREELFCQQNHLRLYGQDYFKRVEEAGFSTKRTTAENIIGQESLSKYGLNPKEDLFTFSKIH